MPKLTVSDLDRELRNKQLRPIYFIHGPESYLANTALTRIRNYIVSIAGEGFEPDKFSGKDSSPSQIAECAETLPMWTKHKLVIVSEASAIKDAEGFERYFKKPSKTSTIVFIAEKADGRTKFVQLCSDVGAVIECKSLYDDKLPDWIRMEAQGKGKSMSMEAANLIADLVGNNLGELAGALDKIILYIGQKKLIEVSDVEVVLTETGRKSVFEFADAVGHKDMNKAFHILNRLNDFDESEVMLLSMLARHWRILLKARGAMSPNGGYDRNEMPRLLGVNPFFVGNYVDQAKLFSMKQLKSGFRKLYTTDKLLKSSKIPKKTILEKCVRELIQ